MLQDIIKNTLMLLTSGLASQALNFAVMLYLARVLGPECFGKLSFATAFVVYFTIIADFGLSILGTREVARNKNNLISIVGAIIPVRIFLAVIAFFVLLIVVFLVPKPNDFKLLLLLTGISVFPSALLLEWAFQGTESMWAIALSRLGAAFCNALAVFGFIKGVDDIHAVPVVQAGAGMLTALILFVILRRQNETVKFQFSFSCFKSYMIAAFPFGVSLLLIQIIYSFDSVLLGFMRTDLEVGYYNAAYKIVLILTMFGAAYFDALFPSLTAAYVSSHETLKRLQDASARLVVIIALPLAFGGTILSLPLIELFFGSNYVAAKSILQILIWAVAIIFCNMIFARGMWACNQQREYTLIVSFQVIVNIISNLLLIPKFGIKGAAISTVFSEASGFVFYYYTFSKIISVDFFRYFMKPFISASIMSLVILCLNNINCLLLIIIGVIVYACCLFLLKAVDKDDLANIKLVFTK